MHPLMILGSLAAGAFALSRKSDAPAAPKKSVRGQIVSEAVRKARFEMSQAAVTVVPVGVVHAYKNVGSEVGIVLNAANRLYKGWGRKDPVDEIRHEDQADSPFKLD